MQFRSGEIGFTVVGIRFFREVWLGLGFRGGLMMEDELSGRRRKTVPIETYMQAATRVSEKSLIVPNNKMK